MSKEIEEKKAEHEIAEESLSNSWKDEYIVVIVFMFIPINFLAPFVSDMSMTQAFENLAKIPEWMQQILFVLVLVVFGMKKLVYKIADKLFDTKSDCNCKK